MRRIPYSTDQPIQAGIEFCKVCSSTLSAAINWDPRFRLPQAKPVFLNSQQLRYDYIDWTTAPADRLRNLVSVPFSETINATAGTNRPTWSCQVTVDDTNGLTITALKLKNRPDQEDQPGLEPFAAAEDVVETISYKNLEVSFVGNNSVQELSISEAFANQRSPPALEIALGDESDDFSQAGVKLTLNWDIQDSWTIEVVMALVLRGMNDDFDPGGAVLACKLYPQISFQYKRPLTETTKPLPKIEFFRGNVVFVANNSIPMGTPNIPPALQSMAMGRVTAALMTDTNTTDSDSDNVYDLGNPCAGLEIAEIAAPFFPFLGPVPVGAVPARRGTWKSGRALAGVETCKGGSARFLYKVVPQFGLPHWSHLFDYGTPILPSDTAEKRFCAVYRRGESTPSLSDGTKSDGGTRRHTEYVWPLDSDQTAPKRPYKMYIEKYPRQGAYDNLHIVADMGKDALSRMIAAAPFCADKCLHLHWRWGTVASNSALPWKRYAFKGWDEESTNAAAHSVEGAPLIPPNQHLEIAVQRLDDARIQVQYDVKVYNPNLNEVQVILEQGLGMAFSYGGLPRALALAIGVALGVDPPASFDAIQLRLMFQQIYQKIRWFEPNDDHVASAMVQQVPGKETPPGSGIFLPPQDLENL
jgi:hypothetical protein